MSLDADAVLSITKTDFMDYCGSPDYHAYLAGGLVARQTTITPDALTAQEFRKSVKRDKSHYSDLKDDKHFNSWN